MSGRPSPSGHSADKNLILIVDPSKTEKVSYSTRVIPLADGENFSKIF